MRAGSGMQGGGGMALPAPASKLAPPTRARGCGPITQPLYKAIIQGRSPRMGPPIGPGNPQPSQSFRCGHARQADDRPGDVKARLTFLGRPNPQHCPAAGGRGFGEPARPPASGEGAEAGRGGEPLAGRASPLRVIRGGQSTEGLNFFLCVRRWFESGLLVTRAGRSTVTLPAARQDSVPVLETCVAALPSCDGFGGDAARLAHQPRRGEAGAGWADPALARGRGGAQEMAGLPAPRRARGQRAFPPPRNSRNKPLEPGPANACRWLTIFLARAS